MCGPAHFPHSVFGVAVWGYVCGPAQFPHSVFGLLYCLDQIKGSAPAAYGLILNHLFEAYISSVESPCTVDSTSSNLRLLPWLEIGIVSTLPHFLYIILQVVYLSGYHTLFDSSWVLPRIPTYDIQPPREDTVWLVLLLREHTSY
jgi:hypothetical protein